MRIRPYTWRRFVDGMKTEFFYVALIVVGVSLFFVFLSSSFVYDGWVIDEHREAHQDWQEMSTYLNGAEGVDARKDRAADLLFEHPDDEPSWTALSSTDRDLLQSVAATGDPTPQPELGTWDNYWSVWIRNILVAGLLGVATAILIGYGFATRVDQTFLVDLPWRRLWPVALVAVTLLPFGWLAYPVSVVRRAQRARS